MYFPSPYDLDYSSSAIVHNSALKPDWGNNTVRMVRKALVSGAVKPGESKKLLDKLQKYKYV